MRDTSGHRGAAIAWTEGLFQLCLHSESIGLIGCKLHEGNGVGNLLTMLLSEVYNYSVT